MIQCMAQYMTEENIGFVKYPTLHDHLLQQY